MTEKLHRLGARRDDEPGRDGALRRPGFVWSERTSQRDVPTNARFMAMGLVIISIALLLSLSPKAAAPSPAARGVASNFIVPATKDAQGRTIGIRGESGRFLSNDRAELIGLTLTISSGTQEFIVEAKSCLWDRPSGLTTSSGPLSLRSADGKFALSGEGFRFDSSRSALVVSNAVQSRIAKSFSGAPGLVGLSMPATGASASNAPPPGAAAKAEEFLEISSSTFDFTPERVEFRRLVRVREAEASMSCERLTGRMAPGGGMERIEAEGEVRFGRGELRTVSETALYSTGTGRVTLHGSVQWRIGHKEGTADDLVLESNGRFVANGEVAVKLPSAALLPVEWLGKKTNSTVASVPEIQIRSHGLEYTGDRATFSDMVWVTDSAGTELSSGRLELGFATNNIATMEARESVQLRAGGALLTGSSVTYSAETGLATFTGEPAWTMAQMAGTSDTVVLDSKEKEFRATGRVQSKVADVRLPRPALEPKVHDTKPEKPGAPRSLTINSDRLVAMSGKTVFLGNAEVIDAADPAHGLSAEVLAAFFAAGGHLEHLLAESSVRVRSGEGEALGGKAAYDLAAEKIELFESPRVLLRGQRYTADRFVFDLATSQVEMVGAYRIEFDPMAFPRTNAPLQRAAE